VKPVAQHAVRGSSVVPLGSSSLSSAPTLSLASPGVQSPLSSCSPSGSSEPVDRGGSASSGGPMMEPAGIITAYYPCPPDLWRPPVSYQVLPSYPPVLSPAAVFPPVEQPYMPRMYYSPTFAPSLLNSDGRYCAGYVQSSQLNRSNQLIHFPFVQVYPFQVCI
jgi:hypothetical protein